MAVKQSIKLGNLPRGITVGLIVSMISTLIGAAIAAWLLASEKVGEGSVGYIVLILLLISGFLGAMTSCNIIKQKRLPACIISGGVYFLCLLGINALLFQGTYSGVGESALVILAGVLSAALLGLKNDKKMKRLKKI